MNRRKLSVLIATTLITTAVFIFTGCASNAPANKTNINQNVFNEVTAKADSKKALQDFLNSHKNNEILVNSTDSNQIKSYVNKNFSQYFTSNFLNDTDNQIDTGNLSYKNNTFYLSQYPKTINFKNDYLIDNSTVNKENKTIIFKIADKTGASFYVEMIQETGKWKINKVEDMPV